jgi:hypothetical protein
MNLVLALVVLGALAAQYAAWLAWRNFMIWQPVSARLTGSDYREAERHFDRMPVYAMAGDDAETARLTECWYSYDDDGGARHTVQLTTMVNRGQSPDPSKVIWYDPANPARVSRFGPGFWSLIAVTLIAATAWLVMRGEIALEFLERTVA